MSVTDFGLIESRLEKFEVSIAELEKIFNEKVFNIKQIISSTKKGGGNIKNYITEVQNNLTELKTEISTLESQVSSLSDKKNQFTEKIETLTREIEGLQNELSKLRTEVDSLKEENTRTTAENNTLDAEIQRLREELQNYKEELTDIEQRSEEEVQKKRELLASEKAELEKIAKENSVADFLLKESSIELPEVEVFGFILEKEKTSLEEMKKYLNLNPVTIRTTVNRLADRGLIRYDAETDVIMATQ